MNLRTGIRFIQMLLFACGAYTAAAQNVVYGPENTIRNSEILTEIIGEKNGVIYIRKIQSDIFKSDGEYIERFDAATLNNIGSIPVLLNDAWVEHKGRRLSPVLEQVLFYQGRLVMFLSAYDKSSKTNVAYAGLFNEFDQQYALIEVDKIPEVNSFRTGDFRFGTTSDNSRIVVWQSIPGGRNDQALYGVKMYDSLYNRVLSKGFLLPQKSYDVQVGDMLADAQGNIAMLVSIARPKKEIRGGELPRRYHLITYQPAQNEVKEQALNLPGRNISDVRILLNQQDRIVCTGFYSNNGNNGVAGSFYGTYHFSGLPEIPLSYYAFSNDILEQFLKEKSITRGDGLPGFSIDHIFLRNDGGLYTISEQYFVQEVCNRDARGILACNYYYYYNSIIVNSIDAAGRFQWTRLIPKYQSSVNDNGWFSSYAVSNLNDTLRIIFNENPKNFSESDPEKYKTMYKANKSVVALVTLDIQGNIQKKSLFNNKEENLTMRPRFYSYDAQGNLIMPAYGQGNRFRLLKVFF